MKEIKISVLIAIFTLSLLNAGAKQKASIPKAEEIKNLCNRVADWQIATFDSMGVYRALPPGKEKKPWNNRNRYHDLEWECGALYAGMYEWYTVSKNPKYMNWLTDIGQRNNWKLHTRMFHADDHVVGQFYLNSYNFV